MLNLQYLDVLGVREDQDYLVTAELNFEQTACTNCGTVDELYRHGRRSQRILDTPMHGKRVSIDLQRQRWRCRACQTTFLQRMGPEVAEDHSMTTRLLEYVQKHSLVKPFTHVANEVGTSEASVRRVFAEYVTELERTTVPDTPRLLGIDEIYIGKRVITLPDGRKKLSKRRIPRAIFTNIEDRTIIELLEDRKQQSIEAFLASMPYPGAVEVVATDMNWAYRRSIASTLPYATHVVDKFHVLAQASKAMEQTRIRLRKAMPERRRRGLHKDQWILRKRWRDLDDEDRFIAESWTNSYPELAEAHALKEEFFDIFEPDRERADAAERFVRWRAKVPKNLRLFLALARTVDRWYDPILAYFDTKVTNAFTESMNALLRMSDRLGRGYTFDVIRARAIFHPRAQVWRPHQFGLRIAEGQAAGHEGEVHGYSRLPYSPQGVYLGTSVSTLKELIEAGEF